MDEREPKTREAQRDAEARQLNRCRWIDGGLVAAGFLLLAAEYNMPSLVPQQISFEESKIILVSTLAYTYLSLIGTFAREWRHYVHNLNREATLPPTLKNVPTA